MSDPTPSLPPPPAGPGDVGLGPNGTERSVTAPGTFEPNGTERSVAAPGVTEPGTFEPNGTERSVTGPSVADPALVLLDPAPRPGELTSAWRIGTAVTWVSVVLALAAVWNASVQLGLSTWWLGPRGDPQPRVIQLLPFVAPMLMLLGTINNLRWLGWYGLAASGVLAAIGIGDIPRVGSIAATELAIAGAAAAISLASLTGTYRAPSDRPQPPTRAPR